MIWTAYLVIVHVLAAIGLAVVLLFAFSGDPALPDREMLKRR